MKNVIITGGNSGLGRYTAKHLAEHGNYRIILVSRSKVKALHAAVSITDSTHNPNIVPMACDLSSFQSIRSFVRDYRAREFGSIDGILCTAGIDGSNYGLTEDGYDSVFQVNYLGHFLLITSLLTMMNEHGLIALTAGDMGNYPHGGFSWPGMTVLAHPTEKYATSPARYYYSKLCIFYLVNHLSRLLSSINSTLRMIIFNPGFSKTEHSASSEYVKQVSHEQYTNVDKTADLFARFLWDESLSIKNGGYYNRNIHPSRGVSNAYNREHENEVWVYSLRLVGLEQEPEPSPTVK